MWACHINICAYIASISYYKKVNIDTISDIEMLRKNSLGV